MNTLILVGAGCSKGLSDLPVDNEFIGKLEDEICGRYFLKEALDCLYGQSSEQDATKGNPWKDERLEVCWNEIDENFNRTKIISPSNRIDRWADKFYDLAKNEKGRFKYYSYYLHAAPKSLTPYQYLFMFAGWELRKLAAETYSLSLTENSTARYLRLRDKIFELSDHDSLSFISFNYDTLLEQVLEDYYYLAIGSEKEQGYPILKPHGSVNWLHVGKQTITAKKDPIPVDEVGFHDGTIHQHSVVGLVANKREFNLDEQLHSDASEVGNLYGHRILDELSRLLKEAEQLLIIGYSFPFTDAHIRDEFLGSQSEKLSRVILVDKATPDNIEKRKAIISSLVNISANKIEVYRDGVESWIT